MPSGESIASILAVNDVIEDHFFVFVTKSGQVMRSPVSDFINARSSEAIGLKNNDSVVKVFLSDGQGELLLATSRGQVIRFLVMEVNPMGRKSRGVKGMTIGNEDWIVDALMCVNEGNPLSDLLTITQRGFLKRTALDEYKPQGRAGKGIAIGKVDSNTTGYLVGVMLVRNEDVVNVIQDSGIVTKVEMKDVKIESRTKAGIQLIPVLLDDYTIKLI